MFAFVRDHQVRREVEHLERRRADRLPGEHEVGDRERFDVARLTGRQAQPKVTLRLRRAAEDSNERVEDAARRLGRRDVGGEEASTGFRAKVNLHVVLEPVAVASVFEHARMVQEPHPILGAPVEPELEQRREKRVAARVFGLVVFGDGFRRRGRARGVRGVREPRPEIVFVSSRRLPEQIEIVR